MMDGSKKRVLSRKQICEQIGALIITMQTTERLIHTTLSYALPSAGGYNSLDDLLSEVRKNEGATLGRLIAKLKQRVELADDFEDVLRAFLKDRNALVHDLQRVPGFDLSSREGRAVAGAFLANLAENHLVVMKVFVSLLSDWSSQMGFRHEHEERVRSMLGELDGIASQVFFAKSCE